MGRRATVILVGVLAVVVLIGMAGLVWWFTRDEAPPVVDLASTVAQVDSSNPTTDDSEKPGATSSTTENPATSTAETTTSSVADTSRTDTEVSSADPSTELANALDGMWMVRVTEGAVDLREQPAVSFAGYRVDEVLAGGIGRNTAVGRTADVAGSIEISGGNLAAATVVVTMATLRTDDSHRDSHARGVLDPDEFPHAIFTLVEPLDLPAGMADGEAFSGSAQGALTIRGVTRSATFDLQAQVVGGTIVAVGSSEVVFSDYGVDTPTSISVISVEDHGVMEFQLIFTR
ncbi:MAG: YceI family protein [Acidimicrobiaceae bacterium]|nr:YceI family protein [Acidimicrobiaceae bacterium]